MRVLLLNGSPKGGRSNSLRLAEAFLEGMAQAGGELDIERLDISQMDIKPCLGCFSCWKETPGRCCISDDMPLLLEKLLWADLTVWSFPLYYFGLPGKLKTALDRQLPLSLPFMLPGAQGGGHPARYDMGGKRTVLVSTCGFYTAEHNYGSVTAQFDRLCGEGNYTALFCGEGELFGVPELSGRTGEYLGSVRRAGQEYARGGISAETQARLREPLFPRDVYERMADASWGISRDGEKEDEALSFTRQMAALYEPSAYNGRDVILDMDYTDIGKRCRIILGETGSRVTVEFNEKPTTVIHTPLRVWRSIAAGEIEGPDALMRRMYTVEGDFELLLKWDDYFGPRKGAAAPPVAAGKTDMRYVLSPWIVHQDQPHPHRRLGRPLPADAHLDLVHHAQRRERLCRANKFRAPGAPGAIHPLVSKMVSAQDGAALNTLIPSPSRPRGSSPRWPGGRCAPPACGCCPGTPAGALCARRRPPCTL